MTAASSTHASGDADALRPTKIAILALGGQGGGVLADWIVRLAEAEGYLAQSTSVPGVAQRTGTTIYYVEIFPHFEVNREPVLALMPMPGDVDIVIAAELMEAGRGMLRGFVGNGTVLITSTHRDYSIAEKSALGDGIARSDIVMKAARYRSKALVAFDMAKAAADSDSVISSVMLGALAGSGALPFARTRYEQTIRNSGIKTEANLKGFQQGFLASSISGNQWADKQQLSARPPTEATTPEALRLRSRVTADFPLAAHEVIIHGIRRLVDYQDYFYADLYLDRLKMIVAAEKSGGRVDSSFVVTRETARYLAIWMSYEDTIRVAELKTRASRFSRVRQEVRAAHAQIITISEFLHPRIEEICDILPVPVAAFILQRDRVKRLLGLIFGKGRTVKTTHVPGFLLLYAMASLRPLRRRTSRYRLEQERIENWLDRIARAAPRDYSLATEIAECQSLVKGYSDTFERGLGNFEKIMAIVDKPHANASMIRMLRSAALSDDMGLALQKEIEALERVTPIQEAK